MKRGDSREIRINGRLYSAHFVGRGRFCTAWRVGSHVFKFERSESHCCDAIIDAARQAGTLHLPETVRIDDNDDNHVVYRQPFYAACPLRAKHREAWAQYKTLCQAWDAACRSVAGCYPTFGPNRFRWIHHAHEVMDECATMVEDNVPASLHKALERLAIWAGCYNSGYAFEFAPRNLATDAHGNLILLDVVYDTALIVSA